MIFRPKLWTGLGAAVLIGSAGLAACGEGGGEAGETGAAPTAASPAGEGGEGGAEGGAPAGEGGEGGAEGGAATGEAGAAQAYAAVPAASRTALRVAQLKGFFLGAQALGAAQGADEGAALAGQGLLEVFDPGAAELRALGVDEAGLRKAAQSGAPADLAAAVRSLEAAQAKAGGDPHDVARGLANLTAGLYREATASGALDPVEYQHALAAARSLEALAAGGRLGGAGPEVKRLMALFGSAVAPTDPAKAAKAAEVQAQASRIELALSGA